MQVGGSGALTAGSTLRDHPAVVVEGEVADERAFSGRIPSGTRSICEMSARYPGPLPFRARTDPLLSSSNGDTMELLRSNSNHSQHALRRDGWLNDDSLPRRRAEDREAEFRRNLVCSPSNLLVTGKPVIVVNQHGTGWHPRPEVTHCS